MSEEYAEARLSCILFHLYVLFYLLLCILGLLHDCILLRFASSNKARDDDDDEVIRSMCNDWCQDICFLNSFFYFFIVLCVRFYDNNNYYRIFTAYAQKLLFRL